MPGKNITNDDSDFDDAIIEIANEIAQINAIKPPEPPKNDPQIALRAEVELKKAKASSSNIFQILKTLQEVQIHSNTAPVVNKSITSSTIERKYVHQAKGRDQQYHPLTLAETVVVSEDNSDYHNITIDDLFEDSEPKENPLAIVPSNNPKSDTDKIIPGTNYHHILNSDTQIPEMNATKSVNSSDSIITKNITRKLKENEREIFKNILKMQKR